MSRAAAAWERLKKIALSGALTAASRLYAEVLQVRQHRRRVDLHRLASLSIFI